MSLPVSFKGLAVSNRFPDLKARNGGLPFLYTEVNSVHIKVASFPGHTLLFVIL